MGEYGQMLKFTKLHDPCISESATSVFTVLYEVELIFSKIKPALPFHEDGSPHGSLGDNQSINKTHFKGQEKCPAS